MIKELLPGDAAKRMRPAVTRLSSSRSGLAARLSLLHALTFLSVGVYIPFFPLWLASRGVSDVAIGVLLTIPIVARVLAASGAAGLGDGRVPPVLLLAGLNLAGALFYAAMAAQSDPWVIGLLMALSATATAGVIPLADMLTTAQVRAGAGIDYGRVRLWGSVSFFAANLLGGVVIARQGAGIVPMAMAACVQTWGGGVIRPRRNSSARRSITSRQDCCNAGQDGYCCAKRLSASGTTPGGTDSAVCASP